MMFKLLRKWSEPRKTFTGETVPGLHCEYEAEFWDEGRRVRRVVRDRVAYRPDGSVIGMANTARSVSYFSALSKAMGV